MSTSDALPKGQKLRRAVQWVSDRRREAPDEPLASHLDEATRRYDLSPRESEFLIELLRGRGEPR